jgi:hypothetical protein
LRTEQYFSTANWAARSALAGAGPHIAFRQPLAAGADMELLERLALLFEDGDHFKGAAGGQGRQQQFHGAQASADAADFRSAVYPGAGGFGIARFKEHRLILAA